MRETVKDFILRAVPENMDIRVEADDMLPIKGNMKKVVNLVDGLYMNGIDIINYKEMTIHAVYHPCN